VSTFVRYFADAVVTLKAVAAQLQQFDPGFKIDGGELSRGGEMLAEIEINAQGSDLFAEDLASKVADLERVGSPAARHLVGRMRRTQSIVTLHILDTANPQAQWEQLTPVWSALPALSTGVTQSDGQGFFDNGQLVVPMA
jgi:hypothetical protein